VAERNAVRGRFVIPVLELFSDCLNRGCFPSAFGFDSTCVPVMEAGRYGETLFE
jgi:hypothetical protein